MSNYTSNFKRKLSTPLDDFGRLIDIPRLDNESLLSYRERLLDSVLNKSNASITGTNLSLARQAGLVRSHVFTIDYLSSTNDMPEISITSKFFRIKRNDDIILELDLYTSTLESLNIQIGLIDKFSVSYFDEDFASIKLTKLFYGNNLKVNSNKNLLPSRVNNLEISYIKDILFTSDQFRYKKDSLTDVIDIYDYYIDDLNGIVFTGSEAAGACTVSYYEIPYKIYYTPVAFYPLNDTDIDYIIKDSIVTDNGEEQKILNSKGSTFIKELISSHPINWGI